MIVLISIDCSLRLPSGGIDARRLRADDGPLHVPSRRRRPQMRTLQGRTAHRQRGRRLPQHQRRRRGRQERNGVNSGERMAPLFAAVVSLRCHLSVPAGPGRLRVSHELSVVVVGLPDGVRLGRRQLRLRVRPASGRLSPPAPRHRRL